MNTYQVHYFGLLADRRGLSDETVHHSAATARGLYEVLATGHSLQMPHHDLRAAVNDELVPWDHPLADGDQIAFLPPMSGG